MPKSTSAVNLTNMQYLLSKEEYENLMPKKKYSEALDKINKLNGQVLKLSNFTCITELSIGYCDICPITETCNKPKRFSK